MGATKEQAEKTKYQLLEAALIVFSKKGFNSTRLEDISQKAGVTRGAFYWHFKNKTEIFCELHKRIITDLFQIMQDAIDSNLSPLTNLRKILKAIILTVQEEKNAKMCGKIFYAPENSPGLSKELMKLKKETEPTIFSFFKKFIDDGKNKNEIRNDKSTEIIFRSLVVTLNGTIVQVFDGLHTFTSEDINSILDIFIDGIKTKK